MFSDSKKSKNKSSQKLGNSNQNRISSDTTITGDIESEGCFRIEGTLLGNLKTSDKVVLAEMGRIVGDVECGSADLEGVLEGRIDVLESLNLRATCTVNGEITTGKLSIEPGATLNGTCNMKGAVKTLQNEPGKRGETKQKGQSA